MHILAGCERLLRAAGQVISNWIKSFLYFCSWCFKQILQILLLAFITIRFADTRNWCGILSSEYLQISFRFFFSIFFFVNSNKKWKKVSGHANVMPDKQRKSKTNYCYNNKLFILYCSFKHIAHRYQICKFFFATQLLFVFLKLNIGQRCVWECQQQSEIRSRWIRSLWRRKQKKNKHTNLD